MDGGAWWAAVHGVAKSQTRLRDFTFTFHFDALEKEMVTHSSVLTWRIPGTEEPGGLPSLGLHSLTRLTQLSNSSSSRCRWEKCYSLRKYRVLSWTAQEGVNEWSPSRHMEELESTQIFLPGKSHGWRSLLGYCSWGHRRLRHNLVTEHIKR